MTAPRLCGTRACPRPAHDNHATCTHCAWLLERDLAETPALADELDTTRARQTATRGHTGRATPGIPMPYDPRAADAATTLHRTLRTWAERVDATPDRPTTRRLAHALLAAHPTLIAHHPAAVTDIGDAVAQGWRVVDRPPDRTYAGPCTPPCREQLYTRPGQPHITCRACGARHDADDRRAAMQDDLDARLMTGAEIARLLAYFGDTPDRERTRNLLKVWRTRGVITPHAHTRAGDPLYPFGDTVRLLTARAYTRTG